jgi:hypothetical protein
MQLGVEYRHNIDVNFLNMVASLTHLTYSTTVSVSILSVVTDILKLSRFV